jgi:hypothetical protein
MVALNRLRRYDVVEWKDRCRMKCQSIDWKQLGKIDALRASKVI